ncbi:IL-1-beta inhibitor [Murmansk poxvirus]|uniref:IL-1-beta inhibitor n=1 Tax=Murmansk poxvirus TaxID=2025359 RepID=A0A223FN33_9POXV|nr:IL-1-beta inhibitor [Murmansk poxvirus]AST09382.1 IL-1-beta inhibitor [Murmansk poxvirus]
MKKFIHEYEYDRSKFLEEFVSDNDGFIKSTEKDICIHATLKHNCNNVRKYALDSSLMDDLLYDFKIHNSIEIVRATKFVYDIDLIRNNWISRNGDSILFPVIFIANTSSRNTDTVCIKTYKGIKIKKTSKSANFTVVINPSVNFKISLDIASYAKVMITFCKLQTELPKEIKPKNGNVILYRFSNFTEEEIPIGHMLIKINGCIDGNIYILSPKFMCGLRLQRSIYRYPLPPAETCSCCYPYSINDNEMEISIKELTKDIQILNTNDRYYVYFGNLNVAKVTYFNSMDSKIQYDHYYIKVALGVFCKFMIKDINVIVGVNHNNTFLNCIVPDTKL